MKFRLIAARSGLDKNQKPWGSLTFAHTAMVAGANVDIIASRFVGNALIAESCKTALESAKAKGTGLFVEVSDCVLRTDRSQYVPKGQNEAKWGTQHSIVAGTFGPLTEEARSGGNVDLNAFESSLPNAEVDASALDNGAPAIEAPAKPALTVVK